MPKPAADGHDKRRTSLIIASLALLCQPAWTDVICECGLVCVCVCEVVVVVCALRGCLANVLER